MIRPQTFIISLLSCIFILTTMALADTGKDLRHLTELSGSGEADRAIDKGLLYLIRKQNPETGAFPGKYKITNTALACMALMAGGEQAGRTRHGEALEKGIRYLVNEVTKENHYLGRDGGRMYGHAIATIALCEAYGMMADPQYNRKIRKALDPMLKLILEAQVTGNEPYNGGWRYHPDSKDADLSVTAMQILAIRAAENCGFKIPEVNIEYALDYVRSTYRDKEGFAYNHTRHPTPSMLAAGIVSMRTLGAGQTGEDIRKIKTAAQNMLETDIKNGNYFYYQSYYLALAANMLGGEYHRELWPRIAKKLMALQNKETGEFPRHSGYDDGVYATAFAVLTLAVNYQLLPIYQD